MRITSQFTDSLRYSVGLINCRFTLGFPSLSTTVHFPTNRFVTPSYTRFNNVDVASWFNLYELSDE